MSEKIYGPEYSLESKQETPRLVTNVFEADWSDLYRKKYSLEDETVNSLFEKSEPLEILFGHLY